MAVASKFMKTVLGLDDATVDKVMAAIKASGSGSNIGDSNIRQRIGNQSMTLISKAFDAVGSDDDSETEEKEEPEMSDDTKEVKEGFTLKSFLINEEAVRVEIDANDPASINQAKMAARQASRNPARASQMEIKRAREMKKAAAAEEGPAASLKKQIAATEERLAMQRKRLRDMEKTQAAQ